MAWKCTSLLMVFFLSTVFEEHFELNFFDLANGRRASQCDKTHEIC